MKNYIIGTDVGGTNIKIMIMRDDLFVLDFLSIPTDKKLSYEEISDSIIENIEKIFHKHGAKNKKIVSVGMGLPGIIDKKNNRAVYLPNISWNDFNPAAKIGSYYNCPSFIDNDASLNAFGEYIFGIKKKYHNIVLITLGTGFGAGIIIGGKIFRGSSNAGGEIGHMVIVSDVGEKCVCGNNGCLEAYCSGNSLEKYTLKKLIKEKSILNQYIKDNGGKFENIFISNGYEENDKLCIDIMKRFVKHLAIGISNIIKIFNPEIILLSGGISNSPENQILIPLKKEVSKLIMNKKQECIIEKAHLGYKAGMYGACAFALEQINFDI